MVAVAALVTAAASAASADEHDRTVIRVGLHAAEKNLNPFIVPSALPITHDFTMLVYDTLFWSQARLDPEPWLATSAEPSEDYRTWTVNLREGVTWHDGTPFSAADVAFTYQYFSDIAGPGRYGHHVYDHPVFAGAEVIDDLTVSLSFEEPVATFELLPGGDVPILPRHIWEGIENPRADAVSLPIGTGPYRMVSYEPGVSYRLEANEDYFLGAPLVDEIIAPVVTDAQAAFAGLRTGELDFVTRNLPAPLVAQLADDEELALIEGTRMQSVYLMFNTRKPVLRDPAVRKAMSMALDVQLLTDIVEGGLGRPGNDTWTHPDSPWAHPTGGHTFDRAGAGAMLDAAGYTAGSDGTRVSADGTPLAFTLLVNATAPPQIRAGELVAEQLAEVGVDITVEPLDPPAIAAARRPGESGPPTVEMFIAVFESHAHADPDHLFFFFHTPGRGVGGIFSGYANPEFDALVEQALSEPVATKLPLIHAAQEIFAAEAPAVVLFYPNGRWAYRPSAYDGWISDPGHGVFTKRSFLPQYANVAAPEPPPEPEPAAEEPAATDEAPAEPEVVAEPEEPEPSTEADDAPVAEADDAPAPAPSPEPAPAPAPAEPAPAPAPAPAAATDDDGGLGGGAIAGIVIAAIAVAGLGGWILVRRRRQGTVED